MTNTDGWSAKEKRELGKLTLEAERLEAQVAGLNKLADAREKLAEAEAKTAEAKRR